MLYLHVPFLFNSILKNYFSYPKITKTYVLNNVTQEQIFEEYLKLEVNTKYRYTNPLRKDNNPGCLFYYSLDNRNQTYKLKFRDPAVGVNVDCFDIVRIILSRKLKRKITFFEVLEDVCKTFKINKYEDEVSKKIVIPRVYYNKNVKIIKGSKKEIIVTKRNWNKYDVHYWQTTLKITKYYLEYYNVLPVERVYIKEGKNTKLIYIYNVKDPCYCYNFTDKSRKVYFPYRGRNNGEARFYSNHTTIEGVNKMLPSEIGVINKSYKDVIALKRVCDKYFDVDSISVPSESYLLKNADIHAIKHLADYWASLYDYDFTGRRFTVKNRKLFNFQPIFFTNGKHKTIDYKAKDFSEFLAKNGLDKTRLLIDNVITYYRKKLN